MKTPEQRAAADRLVKAAAELTKAYLQFAKVMNVEGK